LWGKYQYNIAIQASVDKQDIPMPLKLAVFPSDAIIKPEGVAGCGLGLAQIKLKGREGVKWQVIEEKE
jgi:hypothetical protein